ncbi:hypothetical protein D3P09_02640 [Paenibacillus pinisoli]|uniref:Type II secretion system protein GspF domain-containing protein n=1 Tax=Paenibacillus pinisoli TaxID=1276110 RepID=A0A3A6Q056_9BACL|nr:hypothetical protein [Paenibacillus pinisoli]RJX40933.1 hypothetical protein D3P09_02640 [Paenibacillus pinisoli]
MDWFKVTPELAVKIGLMIIYALCAYRLIGVLFAPMLRRWRSRAYLDLDPNMYELDEESESKSRFSHLDLLIRTTTNPSKYTRTSVTQFVAFSLSLFFIGYFVLLVGSRGQIPQGITISDWWSSSSFFLAAVIGGIPYSWLHIKLQLIRNANSYALIDATELLLIKHRTPGQDPNIYHVLSEMVEELEGPMKRTFYTMVSVLQVEGKTAMKEAVELFEYQIKNTWSRQLGILLIKAAMQNRNIERALQKLHEDMVEGKQIVAGEKTEYMESIIMGFFPLFLVPGIIYITNDLFDGAVVKLMFKDPSVFQSLVICVLFVIIGLATSLVLSRPKVEV